MPTRPWTKAIVADGLLSGLRSKGSGSLVVQTGFPTSLADLVVKNHGRLKKASRANKKKPSPAPDLSASGSVGAATRFPALGCHSGGDAEILKSTSTGPSAEPGHRFRLPAGTLIVLAVLLVGKKKLVLWITVSAFSLLLLELCGRCLRPCLEARKQLDSVIGSFDLRGRESASSIKHTRLRFHGGSPVSARRSEEFRIPDQSRELFAECRDLEEDCRKGKLKSSGKCDAKKLLRKFILNKTHGIREGGRTPHCLEATGEELSEQEKGEGDDFEYEVRSFKASYGDLGDGDGNKLEKCFQFVLLLIVLCGLMRGKTVALVLALAWCFIFRFIRVMWKRKIT